MQPKLGAVFGILIAAAQVTQAHAAGAQPFAFLAPGFTQALYATDLPFAGGVAFAPNGDPLVAFSTLFRIDSHNIITRNGSAIHPTTAINPPQALGLGIANSVGGGVYANMPGQGVAKIDPATGAILGGPFGAAGNELGIARDPQTGNLVYAGSDSAYYFVSPDLTTQGSFSTVHASADGIAFDPTGNFLFASVGGGVTILDRHNHLVQTISLANGACCTDGMAFHSASPQFVISNNTDGTMTRYDFSNNDYTQAPTQSIFASGGFRGDILQVGQDGCLYLMQGGTRFDDGTETSAGSLVQICGGFAPPLPTAKTTLTETANPAQGAAPLTTTFTYDESNTGTIAISNVAVSGSVCGSATYQSGDTNANGVLDPGETWVFTCAHTFTSPGTFTDNATATGTNADRESASAGVLVTPSEQPITAAGVSISATEGNAFTGAVATFTDPDANATAAEYSATIDWADGGSSVGTISPTSGGNFSVSGNHTYAEEGTYHVAVTITDTDNPSNSAIAKSTANVGDAALKASPACSSTSLLFYNGPTATFTDAASPFGTLSDFSATINWGDGTPVTGGTVTGPNGGPYAVSGSHTYATTGNFTITTTVKDVGGSMATTSCSTLGFSFAPGGGSFVIGDQNAVIGHSVTFWGAQWAKLNSLSGGKAPSSFKGFAEDPKNPACSLDWSADPGNSTPPPPGPLPAFMGVIVTSSTSKFGSTISGNTVHIVIVQTNPGYAPNPGHAGTGTVVAVVC